MSIVNCQNCEVPFHRPEAWLKRQLSFTCSVECAVQLRRKRTLQRRSPAVKADGYYLLPLANGKMTKVSTEDFDWASQIPWSSIRNYVNNPKDGRLHRLIMERVLGHKLQLGQFVDHVNRDTLDNRRENLRVATKMQNAQNKRLARAYKGCTWRSDKKVWESVICIDGRNIYAGRSRNLDEALWLYDQFAVQLFGEFAATNFAYEPVQAT